jgi:hypothetical protein
MRVLIDTNVVLDLLQEREPFVEDAAKLFERAWNCNLISRQNYPCIPPKCPILESIHQQNPSIAPASHLQVLVFQVALAVTLRSMV